jgi:hypothetical protein
MTAVLLSVAAHLWSQYRVSIPHLVATPIVSEACATKLIGNCSKTWYCHRRWRIAWRMLGSRFSSPILAYILGGSLPFDGCHRSWY